MVTWFSRRPKLQPDQILYPAVLTPGWTDGPKTLARLADYLFLAGIHAQPIALTGNDGRLPMEALAEQLAQHIENRYEAQQKVDLVGFSMGGLINRYYVQRLGGMQRVRRFITICTPHFGTFWARRLPKLTGFGQMHPDSAFLADLNQDLSMLADLPFTAIGSPMDVAVLPTSSAFTPVSQNISVWTPGHWTLLRDRRVLRTVRDCLQS